MINATKVANMHLLPCEVQHNGEANVHKYFQSTVKDQNGVQSPNQRGKKGLVQLWDYGTTYLQRKYQPAVFSAGQLAIPFGTPLGYSFGF